MGKILKHEDAGVKQIKGRMLDKDQKERLMKGKQKYVIEWMQRNRKDWNAVCKHAESVGTRSTKQIPIEQLIFSKPLPKSSKHFLEHDFSTERQWKV